MGMGPMTGRRAGFCAGFSAPGDQNPVRFGGGFGCGRGFRKLYYATGVPGWARQGYTENPGVYPAADEKMFLSNQAGVLENQLKQIKKRLSSLNEVD
jgi:hypothetical protein